MCKFSELNLSTVSSRKNEENSGRTAENCLLPPKYCFAIYRWIRYFLIFWVSSTYFLFKKISAADSGFRRFRTHSILRIYPKKLDCYHPKCYMACANLVWVRIELNSLEKVLTTNTSISFKINTLDLLLSMGQKETHWKA